MTTIFSLNIPMTEGVTLLVALPLLAAFLLPVIRRVSTLLANVTGPIVLIVMIWLVSETWLMMCASDINSFSVAIGGFVAPQGIVFYVDQLAMVFALAVPLMTLLLWNWSLEKNTFADTAAEDSLTRQHALTMLLVAASVGLSLSGDLFNLYVFYELAAVASYGLITASFKPAAYAASYRYLLISAAGSVLALLGIALIYFQAGSLNLADLSRQQGLFDNPAGLAAFILLLLGFGVKAELFPVNQWVPEVYLSAGKRLSGLLAGLVSKLSVLVIVKVLVLLFPNEEARQVMLILGVAGVVFGELSALRAQDFTRMLAWSSIGQLGLVFVAFSIPGKLGIMAGIAVAIHHLVAKPALFLMAEKWGQSLLQLKGAAKASPLMAALYVLLALSLVGVPPFPGFWAKFLLLSGLAEVASNLTMMALVLILVMTVVEANYLFRVISLLYNKKDTPVRSSYPKHAAGDAFSALVLGLMLLLATVFIQPLAKQLDSIAVQTLDTSSYIKQVLPHD